MRYSLITAACAGLFALGTAVHATPLVTNGDFNTTATTKTVMTNSNVPGWTIQSTSLTQSVLTFIDTPGTASDGQYLSVYAGFPATSPVGGSFIMADGDPHYSSFISQLVSGLTIGDYYQVSFYQAGGEQLGFTSNQACPTGTSKCTTENWQVSLGTKAATGSDNAASMAAANQTNTSPTQYTVQGSYSPWTLVTMTFTATAASEYLTFLAGGTPGGAPPIAFLDGVTMTNVPEPMTLSLLGIGLIGTIAARRRVGRRAAV